jgi:hypothetical protein
MILTWLLGALIVAAIAIALNFNRLVRHRNLVREAWSGIDVQLKRRHDLVPSLVESVRGHATFERGVLEDVTRLRGGAPASRALQDGENALSAQLRGLLAVAEPIRSCAPASFLALRSGSPRWRTACRWRGATQRHRARLQHGRRVVPVERRRRRLRLHAGGLFQVERARTRGAAGADVRRRVAGPPRFWTWIAALLLLAARRSSAQEEDPSAENWVPAPKIQWWCRKTRRPRSASSTTEATSPSTATAG